MNYARARGYFFEKKTVIVYNSAIFFSQKICFFAHLFVPLTYGLRYSRSKKLKILLVFRSLIRTFVSSL